MPTPTLVLRRGNIYSMARGEPEARDAIALRGGRIVACGTSEAAWSEVPEDSPEVDLDGLTILPGFTDSHVHWANYALQRRALQLNPGQSLSDVVRLVRQAVGSRSPGDWVIGRGWDHTRWGQWPTTSELDEVAPDNPVALMRKDGHVMWVNSAALTAAGISAATPDPPGGEIARSNGDLLGILKENAVGLVRQSIPQPEPVERQAAMVDSWPEAWSCGITGCHDMGFMGGGALFRDVATLRDAGELGLRFVWYFTDTALDEAVGLGLRTGLGDDWLRVGGLKLFLDGTLGSQTAHVLEPYGTNPAVTGIPTLDDEQLHELLGRASAARLAVAIHAIGDRAVRRALDGLESIGRSSAERVPGVNRIEHVQLIHPTDIGRFKALGVAASVQPIHYISDLEVARAEWDGRESIPYPWRTLADAGAMLLFGSDAPVESPGVFDGLHAAVSRRRPGRNGDAWRPEEAVPIEAAIRAYTLGPAEATGQQSALGSLESGKLADLIVVDRDPFTCPPEDLPQIRVMATMIDGIWVWQRPEADFAGPRHS